MKSYHFPKCSRLLLYIIGYNNISWRVGDPTIPSS